MCNSERPTQLRSERFQQGPTNFVVNRGHARIPRGVHHAAGTFKSRTLVSLHVQHGALLYWLVLWHNLQKNNTAVVVAPLGQGQTKDPKNTISSRIPQGATYILPERESCFRIQHVPCLVLLELRMNYPEQMRIFCLLPAPALPRAFFGSGDGLLRASHKSGR